MKKLAAVVMADVVGYSKMMSFDEASALQKIKSFSESILKPRINEKNGTLIKSMGDGWLIVFDSATRAGEFGINVQNDLSRQKEINLRIGIHTGDVEFDDNDVFGETVNIAARLETVAEPGELAVSFSTVIGMDPKLATKFRDCGKHSLKNISMPIDIWSTGRINESSKGLSNRDSSKKYIAIVPFSNTGGSIGEFTDELIDNLAVDLNAKSWIDSIVQKYPAQEDFKVTGRVNVDGNKIVVGVNITAPDGKSLWSTKLAGNPNNRSALAREVSSQVAYQTFVQIMRVRGKY